MKGYNCQLNNIIVKDDQCYNTRFIMFGIGDMMALMNFLVHFFIKKITYVPPTDTHKKNSINPIKNLKTTKNM